MTTAYEKLFELRDEKYADFQSNLTPTVPREFFIGVRVPKTRILAKEYFKLPEYEEFMGELPHKYYDENMLHALLICEIKDYDKCIGEIERFLPYVDNWAVCDIMSPKVFKKHRKELLEKIRKWAKSPETYTCRFALDMLMGHFLDSDFKREQLDIAAAIRSDEYYINMAVAWYFATALAKQWDDTVPYIERHLLGDWVHRKTIQKSCESYRITDGQKEYLKTLK